MKHYIKLFLIFTCTFLLSTNSYCQIKFSNQVDSIMRKYNIEGVFNGNILVSKNNKVIYNTSFGYSDETKTTKLTTDYRFNIGSITKEFSAVALMQLNAKGVLQLEDKVSKFIPELSDWSNQVSIRDLLLYTSGMPNVIWKTIKNDTDLFEGLKQIDTLDFKPGTAYDYNNNNIFLRHFIIERLTGMSYKAYVEQFIFKPNKINFTIMGPFEMEINIAKGFDVNLIQDKIDLPITGGIYTTTNDLFNWVNRLHSKKVIDKKALYEIGQQFNVENSQSALGQAKFNNFNLIFHSHHGRAGNYEALLISDIEKKFTIVLLSNNYNGKIHEIAAALSSIFKN
jgi:CubicO group peptidase (beta-lactamase class C family)